MERKTSANILFFIFAILLIIFDQGTKLAVKGFNFMGINHKGLGVHQFVNVIGNVIGFVHEENEGMAFSISLGPFKFILSLFSIIASIALSWYLFKLRNFSKWVQIGIMLILAGAVGNLVDRVFYGVMFGVSPLFYGKVVDFIKVFSYPVFNVADSCVTIGVVILLIFHKKIPTFSQVFRHIESGTNTVKENLISNNLSN